MAISFVGSAEGQAIDGANFTITMPGGVQQNDFVLVLGSASYVQATGNFGVSTAGYTSIYDANWGTGNQGEIAWKIMGASPDSDIAIDAAAGVTTDSASAVVLVFRGVDTTTPIDVATTSATGSSTTPDSPSITTDVGGVVCSGFMGDVTDATVTAPTGYNNQVDITSNDGEDTVTGLAWIAVGASTTENPPSWTGMTSADWNAFSIAIRAAAVGGGGATFTFGYIF